MLISVILPTYNEKENIRFLVPSIYEQLQKKCDLEIIIVDDNSPDGTAAVAEKLATQFPKGVLRVEKRMEKPGLTKSIQHGIDQANGDVLIWLDADGSMSPDTLPTMVDHLKKGVDIIVASRYIKGGNKKKMELQGKDLVVVTALSMLLNGVLKHILQTPVTDYTSGFIAVRKNVLQDIRLQGDYGEYFIDLVVRAHRKGYVIVEIPHTYLPRVYGESKTAGNLWSLAKRGFPYLHTVFRLLRS